VTRRPFLGILLAIFVCTAAQPIHAASIAVTTTVDELNADGDCSLREAVRAANTNAAVDACPAGQNDQTDTITVPAGTYTLTLAGSDNDAAVGDLDLRDNAAVDDLVITGAGAATTIIQACAVEQLLEDCPAGQGVVDRVLHLLDAHVAISGVTIRHGRAPDQSGTRTGSGIWMQRANTPAALTLTDVVITKNGAATGRVEGGGIANSYGVLTLTRAIISDNQGSWGGGIHNVFSPATLVMTDSTVSGNAAGSGGGIVNEAAAVATLTNSTISDNHADTGGGGGVLRGGGGILNYSNAVADFTGTVVTLTNSTLSGNSADDGAGGGFSNERATATLTNCTVSGNQAATFAGGIYNSLGTVTVQSSTVTANRMLGLTRGAGGIYASNPIVLRNTIVAGNFHDATDPALHSPDCTG
jgi:CSLREA domain-containing protein